MGTLMIAGLRDVEGITPDWLRAAVSAADADAFAQLTSLKAERLAEGVGIAADLYRLTLGYAPGAAPGPASLVLKVPSSNPAVRAIASGWGHYRRETLFYREIAGAIDMRIPRPWVSEYDPETHDFVLVLEDLAPAVDGDQTTGLSLEQARQALDEIAILHAHWWGRPELTDLAAAIEPFGEGSWLGAGQRVADVWPAFAPFVAARASPALMRVCERMEVVVEPLMARLSRTPRTLCHGDFRADNLMFRPGGGERSLFTIDWQSPVQARGSVDVSYLLSMSVTTELRRAHEDDLLRRYHNRLTAAGVEAYGYDEFLDDYRRATLVGFVHVILAGGASDLSHGRMEALFDCAVRRFDAAVADHGLEALVA